MDHIVLIIYIQQIIVLFPNRFFYRLSVLRMDSADFASVFRDII